MNKKRGLFSRRIPNGLAFLLLFLGIGLTTYFVQQRTNLTGNASPEKQPQNVIISNIGSNTFTVNFTTSTPASAAISIEGGGNPPAFAYDQGNSDGNKKSSLSHIIRVTNLSQATNYKFTILSDGETYMLNNKPYSVTTGPILDPSTLSQNPVSGSVLLPEGGNANETIVEIKAVRGQSLTTITRDDGTFTIPTESMRKSDLASYLKLEPEDRLNINAYRGDQKASVVVLVQNSTDIPPITLSQNYNFTSVTTQSVATAGSQLKAPTDTTGGSRVSITTPTKNQSFVDSRPRFGGNASPNENVKITIKPSPISENVISNSSGIWTFRSVNPLLPGNYTLTIQSEDQFGIVRTVSQSFTIFSSGSQVNPQATQSATPTIKATPTPTRVPSATPTRTPTPTLRLTPATTLTPTATPTILPTATPTVIVTQIQTPTPTLLPTVTLAPSPTTIAAITTQPTIPPTGTGATTIALTTISLLLIFAGSALLFLL